MNPTEAALEATYRITDQTPDEPLGTGGAGPVSRPTDGAPHNYTNYAQSAIDAPTGFLRYVLTADDRPAAIAEMSEAIVARWNDLAPTAKPADEWTTQEWHNLTLALAFRYIKGATGELYWIDVLKGEGEEIAEPRDDDEARGIDIRTERGETFQIKTTEAWDDANFDKNNADYNVTVKVNNAGEIEDVRVE
jgi:hypothetical protein